MTHRERREARAARLREWAEKREQKSKAAFGTAGQIADGIPFGQPILIGHHSEKRARRDQDRIERNMRAGVEHSRKAEQMRDRAENIEKAADAAIYSDDPDAVEALEARIADLEAQRDRIKRYNASCRKGARDLSILDEPQKEDLIGCLKYAAFQCKNGAFPAYVLSNLSGNIKRNRDRLVQLVQSDQCQS